MNFNIFDMQVQKIYSNNILTTEFKYDSKTGYKQGIIYNCDGSIKSLYHYKNNLKHDMQKTRYDNGKLKEICHYDNGVLVGCHQKFYENGNMMFEQTWNNGNLDGLRVEYYPNGNKRLEENYSNSKIVYSRKFSETEKDMVIGETFYHNNKRTLESNNHLDNSKKLKSM